MELQSLLEFIRLQRHDFLNHLQVISGFIQMNKGEKAREYLLEVARELERLAKIIHLQVPEATAVFLAALAEAANLQVEVDYDIQCNLGDCSVPGAQVGTALETAFSLALSTLSSPGVAHPRLEISLQESKGCYTCRLVFPAVAPLEALKEKICAIDRILAGHGGRAEVVAVQQNGESFYEILLVFPAGSREPF
ncbi:signal transduction histidine kinase regulating citrate/malate metabolism [Desulfofundulus kuznetsovii DSM 6115]|uniref:Signal transduction histidine kinase regulating citrate/malate metabolism n=1 Tax=Desulfofundulus kuznetsovii (strain DSM 6115 / VKM B-1805 / 17) TaxID=760568 RepID=A0AAU8PR56_DESK7|nr:signal transduction histidine kinase regulating citrate/malate metabolism [Desulfofundulus kuznetsovii DSM 6115]